jgi:hypothetical protein
MMADFIVELALKLKIKDAEDRYHAHSLYEDFIIGLSSFASSDDETDDHYEIIGTIPNYIIEECP